ncbi:hypothetical protein FS749_002475 [Ceratobasidium sp. UAMH 11750]|nr:hypothetical protein FS749_002475 [Ceratobasidium sp. UAMH 11750]
MEAPETILKDIEALTAVGRLHGPFDQPPMHDYKCSPLGTVSKHGTTKRRVINHLSWPQGLSVNDGVHDEEASIRYDAFETATSRTPSGTFLCTLARTTALLSTPPNDWYGCYSMYDKNTAVYLWHSLNDSTCCTYSTGQHSYLNWVAERGRPNDNGSAILASVYNLLGWVSYLGGKVEPKTIKSYITHVALLHVDCDIPFKAMESPLLKRV